jgi:integrase
LGWSARHDRLREVTRDDILTIVDALHGNKRRYILSVLRSLFRHCKKIGTIFRDPTTRIRGGPNNYNVILPLTHQEIDEAVALATTPATRLALILAAVHAACTKDIGELRLDSIDLSNRRLTWRGESARWTTSPNKSCWTGWTTDANTGPPPPTLTCWSTA